jgi:hypothetical protein
MFFKVEPHPFLQLGLLLAFSIEMLEGAIDM